MRKYLVMAVIGGALLTPAVVFAQDPATGAAIGAGAGAAAGGAVGGPAGAAVGAGVGAATGATEGLRPPVQERVIVQPEARSSETCVHTSGTTTCREERR